MSTGSKRVGLIAVATLLAVFAVVILLRGTVVQAVPSLQPVGPPPDLKSPRSPLNTPPPNGFTPTDLRARPAALPPSERLLLAFYYPWYRLDYTSLPPIDTWDDPRMLDEPLAPPAYLGRYDSGDEATIANHIALAQTAGLDGFIVSWSGWEDAFIDGALSKVLDEMVGTDLQASIVFETWYTPTFSSQAKVVSELEYALDTHAVHPNYLTHNGRPVVFLFGARKIPLDGSSEPHLAWQAIVNQLHADGYNPILIGDELEPEYLQAFDGLYPYVPWEDLGYYQFKSCEIHQASKLWIADVFPGYDDRLLGRVWPLHVPRAGGQVYSDTFEMALKTDADWIVVTSFNEWWENTNIEPSAMYGFDYVAQTARFAPRFQAWRSLPIVYVNAAHVGQEDGSGTRPFNTLSEALWAASDGATVRVAGGVYSGPITMTRSINLEGGYEPVGWTRDPSGNPTVLQGNGIGPIVRIQPDFCSIPSVVLDGFRITGGVATGTHLSGGGVHVQDASLLLANDVITGNRAQETGGGIFVTGDSQLTIHNSTISSNTATSGAGIFVQKQTRLELSNVVVARNEALFAGGGLFLGPDVSASVVNSTFADNKATRGGTGISVWPLSSASLAITNSIVWGNGRNNVAAPTSDDLECLGNCAVAYSNVAGGRPGAGNLDADPRFSDSEQGDYHLRHDSPVINAGDPSGVQPSGPAPTKDRDGAPRPGGSGVDMGAYEVSPLASSSVIVDKHVAQPGETLAYTLTVSSLGTMEVLSALVTNSLPLITDYVSGSLIASGGYATYLPAGGTFPFPRIVWTGLVTPAQVVHVNFGVAIPDDPDLRCASAANSALIQSDGVVIERNATTRISDRALQQIEVHDAPHGSGAEINPRTLRTGDTLTLYAVGYDDCSGYLSPVSVGWSTAGTLEQQGGSGTSFAFSPTKGNRVGRIVADDGAGHSTETGLITVEYTQPQLNASPSFLVSVQPPTHRVTKTLTISNGPGLTLTYQTISGPRPFEMTFEWDDSFAVRADYLAWDYYATPERIEPWLAGAEVKVTEVEVKTSGTNVADWVNWDWEVHLSDQPIGLPDGQQDGAAINPWDGYERTAPTQFRVAVGAQEQPLAFNYEASHNFVTGSTSVYPFYEQVRYSETQLLSTTEGLHAQVFYWTGDPRVMLQFNDVELTVRGVVTYTSPDWLAVTPISGAIGANASQVINVAFDSHGKAFKEYYGVIGLQSNDPDRGLSGIPTRMRVIDAYQLYFPLALKRH